MSSFDNSLFARLLRLLSRALCKYPKWFIYPQILLFGLCVYYTVHGLTLDMSRDNLVGAKKRYHQNFLKFRKEFPGEEEIVVVVESENMDRNRQFIERLEARLNKETNTFTDIFVKGDIPSLGPKALLLVPENELEEMRKAISDYAPFIQEFTHATNLDSLFGLINKQFRTAKREKNAQTESLIKSIPALQRIVVQATESIARPGTAPSPGVDAVFGE